MKSVIKVGIVGYGFVGKAVEYGFSKNTEIFKVDPLLNTSLKDLQNFLPDIIFACLPTPMVKKGLDSSIIEKAFSEMDKLSFKCPIVIKSTVLPHIIHKIIKDTKLKIVYNPEFLREKHFKHDFTNPQMIILSGNKKEVNEVKKIYQNNSICKNFNFKIMDISSASLIKYAINSFLATKVIFFNELKEIFDNQAKGMKWSDFIDIICEDSRIGSSHLNVPGHDGRKGFGGACFPKDTYALMKYSEDIGMKLNLLDKAIKINNEIRNEYSRESDREKEQNIKF
mgnify:FL=1